MKKILLNISLALALGFSISSCNDWLGRCGANLDR